MTDFGEVVGERGDIVAVAGEPGGPIYLTVRLSDGAADVRVMLSLANIADLRERLLRAELDGLMPSMEAATKDWTERLSESQAFIAPPGQELRWRVAASLMRNPYFQKWNTTDPDGPSG